MESTLPLAQEIIDLILTTIPKTDLKTLRLVCKQLNNSATPCLFDRIHLSSHPLDLEVFNNISKNQILAKGVTELIWDDTTFEPYASELDETSDDFQTKWDEWVDEEFATNDKDLKKEAASIAFKGLNFWGRIARKHKLIRDEGLDEKALLDALSQGNLPNVRSVTRANWPFKQRILPEEWAETRLMSPTRRLWHREFELGEKNVVLDFSPYGDCVPEADTDRGLLVLFRCFSAAKQPLHTLLIRSSSNPHNMYQRDRRWLFAEWGPDLDCFVEVAKNLRVLQLTFDLRGGRHVPNLVRVLQAATELEELRFGWNTIAADISTSVLAHLKLQKLRTLGFRDSYVSKGALLDFLEWHKSSLRELNIVRCTMLEDPWRSILTHLKDNNFRYEHCIFDEVTDWESGPEASCLWIYRENELPDTTKSDMTRDFLLGNAPYPLKIDESAKPRRLPTAAEINRAQLFSSPFG
ncbi:MAG: hypothetical protein M1812_001969 [Candelaria pacifica]|nr:MAG: hypothetical protein M1812_001969 [Candelaria pacifica]